MAPELMAAAERIFRAGFRAGLGNVANNADREWQEWQRNEPGYRPSTPPPMRAAPDARPTWDASSDHGPDLLPSWSDPGPLSASSFIDDTPRLDPTPDTSWGGSDFSGGGGGSGGGAGADGNW